MRQCPDCKSSSCPGKIKKGADGKMWKSHLCPNGSYKWVRKTSITKKLAPKPKASKKIDRATARAAGRFKSNLVKSRRRKQSDKRQMVLNEMECRNEGYADCEEKRQTMKMMGGMKTRF